MAHISGCGGVIGFKVGTWLCPVREKVRPAWAGADASAKKFAQRAQKGQKLAFYGVLGEFFRANDARGAAAGRVFSRKCGWRGRAGRLFSRHWRRWHALRLPVSPARRADHSQAEADRALLPQTNRPPTHHAGAGGNTKNAWDSSSNEQCTRCTRR